MGSQTGKRARLLELLSADPRAVDPAYAAALKAALQPISDSHFRKLLRESGATLHPSVEGIRQDSMGSFERTFLALTSSEDAKAARAEVIRARDHARLARRRKPTPERDEMILWMTVWLENSPVFDEWLRLRKATAARSTEP